MIPFLLTISFLLHIITLFAIFQLVKQQQNNQKSTSQDVMEVMEVYLEEIRGENNRLEKLLKEQGTESGNATDMQKYSNEKEPAQNAETDSVETQENNQLDTLLSNLPQDQINASLESRVLQLHMQGKNIEDIAKRLDCGKTEAELIIKLYQKM